MSLYTFNKLISIINLYKLFIRHKNYTIVKVTLKYSQKKEPVKKRNGIWNYEQRYWTPEGSTHYVDYTRYYRQNDDWLPDNVLFKIKYWHNGRLYNFLTSDKNHTWPPKEPDGFKFMLPITNAITVSADGKITNVIRKVKKAMGPFQNFFNQTLTPNDIIDVQEFNTLLITNLLNKTYTFKSDETIQML